jgi:O-antigen/teichoic acid export membrane protein
MFKTVKDWAKNLLLRSQAFTGTDNVYIARGGFWTTLQFTATSILSLLTVVAFANLLPREMYGTYRYLLSLAGTFGFLTLTGSNTAVIRAVARGQAGVLPYSIRLQLKFNLLAIAATSALAGYYAWHGNIVFALALAFLGISGPLSSVFNTYGAVLVGEKKFGTLAAITVLSALIAAGAVIGTLFITNNIIILIGTYSIATLGSMFLAYRYVAAQIPKTPPTPEAIAELKRTGYHLTFAGFIGTAAQYFDKIFLFQTAGPVALAVYGLAIAGPDRLKGLIKNIVGITLPRLTEHSIVGIRKVFYRRIAMSMVVGAFFVGAYIVAAPILFHWLAPKYLDSIRYSQVYILQLIMLPALAYISAVFSGQNMLRAIYYNGISSQILRISLFALLGWQWQTWGLIAAALITSAATLISNIIIWEWESRRLMHS